MSAPRLTLRNPRFEVIFGDPDTPDGLTALEVQTAGPDFQRVEMHFARNKLGQITDYPVLATALTAYYALVRAGLFDGEFEAFEQTYLEIHPVGMETATPTEPDPVSG